MRNLCRIFVLIFVCIVLGCDPDGEKVICFPESKIDFRSTSAIDSVHFYLNDKRICSEQEIIVEGICKNCLQMKGFKHNYIECKTSLDSNLFTPLPYGKEYTEECITSDTFPIWSIFTCNINEHQYGEPLDSLKLVLYIYSGNEPKTIQLQNMIYSNNHYTIIAKEDSAKWLSYKWYTADPFEQHYQSLHNNYEKWLRDKCSNEFCITSTMLVTHVCYELSELR